MTAVTVLLLSGVYSIGPAEIGIVRRFGHVRQPHATPGCTTKTRHGQ